MMFPDPISRPFFAGAYTPQRPSSAAFALACPAPYQRRRLFLARFTRDAPIRPAPEPRMPAVPLAKILIRHVYPPQSGSFGRGAGGSRELAISLSGGRHAMLPGARPDVPARALPRPRPILFASSTTTEWED